MALPVIELSIVIPAYEESCKIARDIERAASFLKATRFRGEIIIVDDGSSDDTAETAEKAGLKFCRNKTVPGAPEFHLIRLPRHKGKGCALRTGITRTTGEYVMFADSGCCVPFDNTLRGLKMLEDGRALIAHGSRRRPQSNIKIPQPLLRRLTAGAFRLFIKLLLPLPADITDSQCGFKIYRGDIARKLYAESFTDGFMIDVEVILQAKKYGFKINEFPIDWSCDVDSRLSVTHTPVPVLSELMKIRRRLVKM